MELQETAGIISTERFSFELPADWEKLVVVDIQEDGSVLVSERRSYEMMGGGELLLQNYFDKCSWYEGTIAPSDFQEELLNEYGKANIFLMQQYSEDL